jgi:hypothetical protein
VSATANVVIIAAIITKVGPSTHDERHQAAPDLVPRSLVAAITFSMLIVGQANGNRGGYAQGFVDAIDGMGLPLLQGRAWPGRKGGLMKGSLTGLIGHRAVK